MRLEAGACNNNLQQYLPRGLRSFCAQHLRAYSPIWRCMADQQFSFKQIVNEAHRIKNATLSLHNSFARSWPMGGCSLLCHNGTVHPSLLYLSRNRRRLRRLWQLPPTRTRTAYGSRRRTRRSSRCCTWSCSFSNVVGSTLTWRRTCCRVRGFLASFSILSLAEGCSQWYLHWSHDHEYAAERVSFPPGSTSTVPLVFIYSCRVLTLPSVRSDWEERIGKNGLWMACRCCSVAFLFPIVFARSPATPTSSLALSLDGWRSPHAAGNMIILDKLLVRMQEKALHILIFSQMRGVLHAPEAHCHSGKSSDFLSALASSTQLKPLFYWSRNRSRRSCRCQRGLWSAPSQVTFAQTTPQTLAFGHPCILATPLIVHTFCSSLFSGVASSNNILRSATQIKYQNLILVYVWYDAL